MSIKTIFFDLDGTLLPMDHNKFSKIYFGEITQKLAPLGYEPIKLIDAISRGIVAMVKNDGTKTNEKACWDVISQQLGEKVLTDKPIFDEFYRSDFDKLISACGMDPSAAMVIKALREMGYRIVLATNPLFPSTATEKRIAWAGLSAEDFELYTTYENSHYSKPNLKYYQEILEKLKLLPEECLMVGNDVDEDMITESLGMKVFLVTGCLINKKGKDISVYPNGDLNDMLAYIRENLV